MLIIDRLEFKGFAFVIGTKPECPPSLKAPEMGNGSAQASANGDSTRSDERPNTLADFNLFRFPQFRLQKPHHQLRAA
jgi:hypothetical protein